MRLSVKRTVTFVCVTPTDLKKLPIIIPLHDEIAFGMLKRILRVAGITVEQLIAAR